MSLKNTFEKVVDYISQQDRYLSEIKLAKDHFLQNTGSVSEDDPTYEIRMMAFTEWFMLDRPMEHTGIPPVRSYYEMFADTLEPSERASLECLCRTLHSLFLLEGRKKDLFILKELFSQNSYEVFERRNYAGLGRGDVFEGRIIPYQGNFVFSEYFCIHPRTVAPLIVKTLKKSSLAKQQTPIQFTEMLSRLKIKTDRYRNVEAYKIYELEFNKN